MAGEMDSGLAMAGKGAAMGAVLGPWGAVAGGAIGAVAGFALGGQANEARRRAAKESLRRDDMRRNATLGQGIADAGASGVQTTGTSSLATYLAQMSAEFRREHDWQRDQADQGKEVADRANALSAAGSLGSSLFRFGEANAWWQDKT